MKAAIVILNYNGKEMLRQFLPSVIKHSSADVIIVDNKSTDGSLDFLLMSYPQIRIILNSRNEGYAGGYNQGLFQLGDQYEYFILLNSDVEVTANWDSTVLSFLDDHPEVAGAQPKICSYINRSYFDYAGASGGFLDMLGYPYCRGRILHTVEEDLNQYDDVIEIDWASGAGFFIRSKVFMDMGGFEPKFFAHMEEIDLCWRVRDQGMKFMVVPQSVIYHLGGGTLSKADPYKTFLNFRNNLFMLYRNTTEIRFLLIFLLRILLDAGAALHMLLTHGKDHSVAIIKAYSEFLKERRVVKKKPYLASKLSFAPREKKVFSIIWTYYIRKKKIFSGR
ncbi:glycosyltransferase family 2 protein [Anditalea andensis]|uniref:Glycosyl transferase family 2 n=1 Tax=Anditalea andensis TaxID=1048983 RepID=A0A074KXQ7_9BACT|nr:glycosyltransferase family 2 protein [Anditalea andensis]KEO72393.1 glycosyl transferase family 2 [Anditalea andensis]